MIRTRTVIVPDPLARANVLEALSGPGAPAGMTSCTADGTTILIAFEAERTSPELIDALIDIETVFVPARVAAGSDPAATAATAARGLREPALDTSRIIETYLS